METNANYVRVGLFTLLVLALAIGFTYWSVFSQRGSERIPLIVRIEGSVQGLQQGSQILFNGLPVGVVRSLRIDPNNPRVVIAETAVDPGVPIRESTAANIGFQGLTGFAFIELRGGQAGERDIIASALEEGTVPVITADPSDVTDILATARDIADRANLILAEFESLVGTVGPSVRVTAENIAQTSQNVERFTNSLAENSDDIDSFLTSLGELSDTANRVAEGLPATIDSARALIESVDPAQVSTIVDNAATVSENLSAASADVTSVVSSVRLAADSFRAVGEAISANSAGIDAFLANLEPLSGSATRAAVRLDETLGAAQGLLAAVDPASVSNTVDRVSEFANLLGSQKEAIEGAVASAARAASNIETVTASVAGNSEAIDTFLAGIGPVSANADRALTGLNETIGLARGVVAGIDPAAVSNTVNRVSDFATLLGEQGETIRGAVASGAQAASNLETITASVAENSEAIDTFLAGIGPLSQSADQALASLNGTLGLAQTVVAGVDPAAVTNTVTRVSDFATLLGEESETIRGAVANGAQAASDLQTVTASVAANSGAIDSFLSGIGPISANADRALTGLNETIGLTRGVVAAVDPAQVSSAVADLSGIARTVNGQREAIEATLRNASSASESVAAVAAEIGANREAIGQALASLGPITESVGSAAREIEAAATEANRLAQAIDAETVNGVVGNVEAFTAALGAKTDEIQSIIDGVNRTVGTLDTTLLGFDATRGQVDRLLAAIDAERVNTAVGNVAAATDNVAVAADEIAAIARNIGARRDDIDAVITNARLTSERLSAASGRVDQLLSSVDNLLAGGEGSDGLGAEVSATLTAIRETALGIQASIRPIAANLEQFSGQGLREVQTLVRDVTQSVDRIDRAVGDFSADPSRLIYGGDTVKQYEGRTRR